MKIHNVNKMPSEYKRDYEISTLDKDDFKGKFPKKMTDIYYWYATGDYCGTGQVLARDIDGLWYHHDCGHCSCYGPTEQMSFVEGKPIADILSSFSKGQLENVKPLTDQIFIDGVA